MKKKIYNYDNLTEEDITEVSIRVKALIINSRDEILLGKSDISYQFPGGHLEAGESLEDALKREILEETGIELSNEEIDRPFYKVIYLNKDYPIKGINRKSEIYYYVVKTPKEADLAKIKLTENEAKNNYKVEKVPLLSSIDVIKRNDNNEVIERDMIDAIDVYLHKVYGKV